MHGNGKRYAGACGAALLLAAAGPRAAAGADDLAFNRDIRPIFSDTCFFCHGFDAKKRKGDLRLDSFEGATAVRTNGLQAIAPGDLAKSEAWQRIVSKDPAKLMPPPDSHKTLTPAQIETIRQWIVQGAKYQKHWAFEAPVKVDPPQVGTPVLAPVDAFLAARLKKEGLSFSPEAPPETLIRRVSFALTGLPPAPAETAAYLADKSPEAYSHMVERYLASPRYGEEMARHWLDKARYGDTHGLHLDNERQTWAYRDWVIRAFNANEPFDQFTVEQLAGDLLPNATKEQIAATGFNRCNVTTSEGGAINEEFTFRYAVDRASTMAETWMGLTVGCAVCHDHKFDPISSKEFYSLYAFYNSNADPAMDGNALLTQPVIKISSPEQDQKLKELEALVAERQKLVDERAAAIAYTDPATVNPKPPVSDTEDVWMEDEFPKGAQVFANGDATLFVTAEQGAPVLSGKRALKRTSTVLAQDYYNTGAEPLEIPQGGRLFAHAYLDPANPPKAIMVQYHAGAWNRRAIWGDYETIPYGAPNTVEKVNMGALPETGKWVRLEIPIEKLNLKEGDVLQGFAMTQYGGTVYWDKLGAAGRSDPASDMRRSLLAWRTANREKAVKPLPADIAALLKGGPEKTLTPEEEKKLRAYYFQNVCLETKGQFGSSSAELVEVQKQRAEIEKAIPSTFVYNDLPKPRDSFVMIRGQYDKPGEKVTPGTPAVLPPLKLADTNAVPSRLDLATWLVSPDHPLTARVIVNQFWQQMFGVGLVKTSADFGSQGEMPVHPELLDWLAVTFRETHWDVKGLVRMMVNSAAFRQSARVSPELHARDPENRLLARGPRFRLDAEQIRDNVLFVSGLMDFTMGGAGVKPYQPPNIWEPVGFVGSNTRSYKQDAGPALYRRSIYTFLKRTAPPPFMANFDGPNREQFCLRRERSNTPLQALQLMNDVQHVEAARVFAERMIGEGGATAAERVTFAYRTILARPPDPQELAIVLTELDEQQKLFQQDEAGAKKFIALGEAKAGTNMPPAQLAAYAMVASTILNLDETVNRN
jgi:hypothetical protein